MVSGVENIRLAGLKVCKSLNSGPSSEVTRQSSLLDVLPCDTSCLSPRIAPSSVLERLPCLDSLSRCFCIFKTTHKVAVGA